MSELSTFRAPSKEGCQGNPSAKGHTGRHGDPATNLQSSDLGMKVSQSQQYQARDLQEGDKYSPIVKEEQMPSLS